VRPVQAKIHDPRRDVARVREERALERSEDRVTELEARLPEREAAERQIADRRIVVFGARFAARVQLLGALVRVVERHRAVGADLAERIAAVRSRTSREEAAQEHELHVLHPLGRAHSSAGFADPVVALDGVSVVGGEQEADRGARGDRDLARDRDVAAELGLFFHVAGVTAQAGDLKLVRDIEALVRRQGVIAEIERREQLGIRDDDGAEMGIALPDVHEGAAHLDVLRQRRVELPIRAFDADAQAHVAVAEHWSLVRGRQRDYGRRGRRARWQLL
jgi:hypothetical protein